MNICKISIITINYNDAAGLELTIKSVKAQRFHKFEHIIIDGNSTDGSKKIIEAHQSHFSYSISEEDDGVYHAMNKGIARATGRYLLFLNSGDILYTNDTLQLAIPFLEQEKDIVYGDLHMVAQNRPDFIHRYPRELDFAFFQRTSLGHPATFIKRALFTKFGAYRTDLKIVADWEFFLRVICIEKVSYLKMDYVVARFHEGGLSTRPENQELHDNELLGVLKDYTGLYKLHFGQLLKACERNKVVLENINPQVALIATNKPLLKILNACIATLAFALRKKRYLSSNSLD